MLFNGPPGSGKDTAAKFLYYDDYDIVFERFSRPNKTAFAACVGARCNHFFEVAGYESKKDEVIPWLGVSYRQWQIDFAEKYMKPLYGKDIFTKLFIQRLKNYKESSIIVVPDLGFQIEVDTLEAHLDPKDVIIVQSSREGCDYSKDSREDVVSSKFQLIKLDNNGTQQEYEEKVDLLTYQFIHGKAIKS